MSVDLPRQKKLIRDLIRGPVGVDKDKPTP